MTIQLPNVPLGTTESAIILPLEERGPETYFRRLNTRGSAFYSTVYIHALDAGATVTVNYYDFTTGQTEGERYDLQGHGTLAVAGNPPDRKLITRYHDKPNMEVIVAGGNATFSVYITGINISASDLDAALIFDGEDFEPATNQALPIACLEDDTDTLHFIRCKDGAIPVTTDTSDPYHQAEFFAEGSMVLGTEATMLTFTVPANTKRKLSKVALHSDAVGCFTIESNSTIIGSASIGPANSGNGRYIFDPSYELAAGDQLDIKFTPLVGGPTSDVRTYVMANDFAV